MEHRVTDECLPIFNINGTLRKGQKSKLIQKFDFTDLEPLENYIALGDMGFIWRLSTPSAEDRENKTKVSIHGGDYATKMFNLIMERHTKASQIIMVNNPYDLPYSNKDGEYIRRTGNLAYVGETRNVFIKRLDALPSPKHFNNMFQNSGNKIRLQEFLKMEFKSKLAQHPGTKFVYSVRECCCDMSTDKEMCELTCLYMEADTILFFIILPT